MNEYEATFSQDGRYITERRWPFPEHAYEIVNAVPLGYGNDVTDELCAQIEQMEA